MVRRKVPSELDKAEIKLGDLISRRDALNDEANLHRRERDQLHEQKRVLASEMRKLKDERDAAVHEMRAHKAKRNELQLKAKGLIEARRKARGKVRDGVATDLAALRREVARIDMDQQTRPMKLSEENELLDELKAKVREMRELEKLKGEEDVVRKDVKELDATIDELFRHADEEHGQVIALSERANAIHEQVTGLVQNLGVLISEANKKHEEYLETRAKADEVHGKVVELRGKVLSTRDAARAEVREARQLLKQHRQDVRKALYDEKKLDEFAEQAVEALLKKGKVEIRG
ncbi:MAG TPA: hypothetical protein VJ400_02140 [Thermoplasmata archaeon]|nr:hypothetical protein [Thermoplasmata archaeon]